MNVKERCVCCDGNGYIEESNGEVSSCMNCNGYGYLKYSPFRKLIEFCDKRIKDELVDYYFIDKNLLNNIENQMMKLKEENDRLKKELMEYKINETFNKEGNSNEK